MSENINFSVITGQVIDNSSDSGMSGVSVEAWDATGVFKQALAAGKTDVNGRFTLQVNPEKNQLAQVPDLFFKVLDQTGAELANTADQITWNAKLQESVTLYIVTDDGTGAVVDKFDGQQLMTMTSFLGQSDFKGVLSEATGVGGSSLSFIKDMFVNSFGNLQQPPLTLAAKRSDIVGQTADAASRTLNDQQINVGAVLPYTPTLNKTCLSLLTSQPLSLKAGQTVNLYQQDGVVKFYTVQAAAQSGTPACSTGSTQPATGAVVAGGAAVGGGAAVANKDEQITQLQQELAALRKEQEDLKAFIQSKLPG